MREGIKKRSFDVGSVVAFAPKSSLLLDAALSVGNSRRVFDDELAAAFVEEEMLADARLFPPSETCMPKVSEDEAAEFEGV
jgi:hypothetical protein